MENQGQIVDGKKNGKSLVLDGYKYNKRTENKNGTIPWRCRQSGCLATLTTGFFSSYVQFCDWFYLI